MRKTPLTGELCAEIYTMAVDNEVPLKTIAQRLGIAIESVNKALDIQSKKLCKRFKEANISDPLPVYNFHELQTKEILTVGDVSACGSVMLHNKTNQEVSI